MWRTKRDRPISEIVRRAVKRLLQQSPLPSAAAKKFPIRQPHPDMPPHRDVLGYRAGLRHKVFYETLDYRTG